jgi:arginine decarboxylase
MANPDQTPLIDAILACVRRQNAAFHTPGHKGRSTAPLSALVGGQAFAADLPELPELDNLFAPQGVIQTAQALAAEAFGAEHTWFLANGSTSGIMAAIAAVCNPGDKIILPRNVHQSAISGLILSGAVPVFVQPEYDAALDIAHCLTPGAVTKALLHHPDAKAVLMVSPTYYGACGNVRAIAELCHQRPIPLIVDEAHGAHFAFHPCLPQPALSAGADIAVQSIHKTLSALTQAALLHSQGSQVQPLRLSKALALLQSTSPSYLLLASLDGARQQMATQGHAIMERTIALADQARSRIAQIPNLSVLHSKQAETPGFCAFDHTRLTVTVTQLGIDGFTADDILNTQLGITVEFPSLRHLTMIISLGNTQQDIDRLVAGFQHLSSWYAAPADYSSPVVALPLPLPATRLSPRKAFFAATETVAIGQSITRVSAELVCPYPPGIPVLIPGEVVSAEAIAHLQQIHSAGGIITGCADPTLASLNVICESKTSLNELC